MKIKETVKSNVYTTKVIVHNAVEFLDAACLGIVSGFAIYQALHDKSLHQIWAKVLLFAGLVIALQAALLFIRHLNNPKAPF